MKKSFVALTVMLLIAMTATAKSVVFTLSNGTLVYYLLNSGKDPVMKIVEGKCIVNADTYEFSQIKNFYISETDDPNAIKSVEAAQKISYKDNVLVVKAEGKAVRVYSISGVQAAAEVSANDGYITVDLSKCDKGAYIIKVGNASFKVVKN